MAATEKEISVNAGFDAYTSHAVAEIQRESLSVIEEKSDKELYAQPAEEDADEDEDAA